MWADWPLPKSAGLARRRSSLRGARPPNRAAARAAPLRARLRSVPYRRRGARHRFGPRCGPRSPARAPRWGKSDACQSGAAPRPCLRLSQASGVLLPALVGRRGKAILGGRPLPRASAPRVPRALVGRPTGRQGGRPPPAPGARLPVAVPPRFALPPCAGGYTHNQESVRTCRTGEAYNGPVM